MWIICDCLCVCIVIRIWHRVNGKTVNIFHLNCLSISQPLSQLFIILICKNYRRVSEISKKNTLKQNGTHLVAAPRNVKLCLLKIKWRKKNVMQTEWCLNSQNRHKKYNIQNINSERWSALFLLFIFKKENPSISVLYCLAYLQF